ncbi:MAG: hypothetical protein NWR47_01620 [Aestuariivirgaceae bacterium]|nr:hypothetical protein [Aestuariivirgaceae bacterium]
MKGEGETKSFNYFNLQGAAQIAENVYAFQLSNTAHTSLTTADNVQSLVMGGTGSDFVHTGSKDDILIGGKGFNQLYGGLGSDLFVVGQGKDLIGDFTLSDKISVMHPHGKKPTVSWSNEGIGPWLTNMQPDQARFTGTLSNGNSFTIQMAVKDIATALGKTEAEVKAMEPAALMTAMKGKLEPRIEFKELPFAEASKNPPMISDSRDTSRGGTDKAGNQDIWGYEGKPSTLVGGDGNDILHSLGNLTTMTGGKGRDHFHVSLQSANVITDLNHTEGDKIIIDGSDAFDRPVIKDDIVVNKTGNATYEIFLRGAKVATTTLKWTNSDGEVKNWDLSESKALALFRIKIIRQGNEDEDANYYHGVADIKDLVKSTSVTKTFTMKADEMTYIPGFAYSAGHRLNLKGVDPEDVTITRSANNKVTLSANGKAFAELTPPKGTTSLGEWHSNVTKALSQIGVTQPNT